MVLDNENKFKDPNDVKTDDIIKPVYKPNAQPLKSQIMTIPGNDSVEQKYINKQNDNSAKV